MFPQCPEGPKGRRMPEFAFNELRPTGNVDKFPTFDHLLELVDHPGYFFFVQVKTTTKGFTLDPPKLRVQVSQTEVDRMVEWQAPSYVVGIDEPNQAGYLLSVNEMQGPCDEPNLDVQD